jgi:GT2 family glycosyltransferase
MVGLKVSMICPLIIVPIFNAFDFLEPCLDSILRTIPVDADVLLINDASTDDRVRPLLEAWTSRAPGRFKLINNEQNQGFVGTVNSGMASTESDVVLLNSDTEVTPGWLQGLARCLDSDLSIATATPWSNNGEIVSFPQFCRSNPPPDDPDNFAATIANCGSANYPDMPTAVGFCMAISRRALDRVGDFDEATFGRGYGEENDFCQRVEKAGMRNVLCDDAYVIHHGGASFNPLGLRPDENSMQRLLGKHPDYQQKVAEFIMRDPLCSRRAEILACFNRAGIRMR